MSNLVTPLHEAWVEAEKRARDAEWEDAPNAFGLREYADRLAERIKDGEQWEVGF